MPPEASREAGQALFAEDCAVCHGAGLEVMSIVDGYSKRTQPREDMPIIVGLTEGPMVDLDTGNGLTTPTPARLVAIVRYLESIQSPPPVRYVP